jgi:hypothetical protein
VKFEKQTRRQRAIELRGHVAKHRHLFTLKDVCAEADIKYTSVTSAFASLINKDEEDAISDTRLSELEKAFLRLEEKHQSQLLSKTG